MSRPSIGRSLHPNDDYAAAGRRSSLVHEGADRHRSKGGPEDGTTTRTDSREGVGGGWVQHLNVSPRFARMSLEESLTRETEQVVIA